jgi:hypothetical protein
MSDAQMNPEQAKGLGCAFLLVLMLIGNCLGTCNKKPYDPGTPTYHGNERQDAIEYEIRKKHDPEFNEQKWWDEKYFPKNDK